MSFSRWLAAVMMTILLIVGAGCGYHFTNTQSSGKLGSARKIWIPFFSNESISPTAQTVLRRAFYDELHALRGLEPASNATDADLVMKARIISYTSRAASYTSLDQVREHILDLTVELEIANKEQVSPLWKGLIKGAKQYPANTNLALQRNAEEQALDVASRIIAQKFISSLEESY